MPYRELLTMDSFIFMGTNVVWEKQANEVSLVGHWLEMSTFNCSVQIYKKCINRL